MQQNMMNMGTPQTTSETHYVNQYKSQGDHRNNHTSPIKPPVQMGNMVGIGGVIGS